MPRADILELLRSEVEEAIMPLAEACVAIATEAAGSDALTAAVETASMHIDCIRAASEAGGLLGLEVVSDRFRDNLLQLAHASLEQRAALDEALLLWPERVMEYLLAPDSGDACQNLAILLHDASWPLPLSEHEVELVLELLAESGQDGNPSDGSSGRTQQAGPEDVSLVPGDDVHIEVLEAFLDDAPQQAADLASSIQQLAAAGDITHPLDQARRLAHTLKGAAAVAGIAGVTNLTHHLEDLLDYLAKTRRRPGPALMDGLMQTADCLEAMVDALTGADTPPDNALAVLQLVLAWAQRMDRGELSDMDTAPVVAAAGAEAAGTDILFTEEASADPAMAGQSLRVPVEMIEGLYRSAGELSISGAQLTEGLARVQRLQNALREQDKVIQQRLFELEDLIDIQDITSSGYHLHQRLDVPDEDFDPLEMDQYNELHGCSRALTEAVSDWRELNLNMHEELAHLRGMINHQGRLHRDLEDTVLSTRLVPVHTIAARLQRSVRQACRATGKQASLELSGEELALDTELLQALVDPLGHLLRNAVDHGIESPEVRLAAGKPESGVIRLNFQRDGSLIEVICSDDGRGLDLDAIRHRAIERGLLAAEEHPDRGALTRLVLLPGFSTRDQVTHTSGRGIGLDVVHEGVRALKGSLSLDTAADQGTTFTLRLPAALVTVHVLLVEAAGQTIAIPSSDLVHVPVPGSWEKIVDTDQVLFRTSEASYPLHALATIMGHPHNRLPDPAITPPVVLARIDNATRALEVDRLLGSAQVVIKSFGAKLPQVRGVLGATLLGDGTVAPVLDLTGLMQAPVTLASPAEATLGAETAQTEILVVDDSLSMRRALSQFLQDSGFRVRQARDGIEAIQAVEEHHPDLLLVDLEMPRMNGLELTAHLRGHESAHHLPIIMLTSRGMQKHRSQAERTGVNAYLTKPFQETELLETIEHLLPRLQAHTGQEPGFIQLPQ
jgi:chemosensory pili system protein ChpA (sensor histidine kinase/response regulator)